MTNTDDPNDDLYGICGDCEMDCSYCSKGITYDDCIHYEEDVYLCIKCGEGKENICIECYRRPCLCSSAEEEEEPRTVDLYKHPKRTVELICRSCGMHDYYENIADDPNDDEYGTCGECDEQKLRMMWEREMEGRKEKLELLSGMRTINEAAMIKYELNQLTFEEWYEKFVY
jgi:hypothetical protein